MTPKNYTTTTTRRTLDVVIRVVEIQIATQSLRASVQQQGHVAKTCFPIILSFASLLGLMGGRILRAIFYSKLSNVISSIAFSYFKPILINIVKMMYLKNFNLTFYALVLQCYHAGITNLMWTFRFHQFCLAW